LPRAGLTCADIVDRATAHKKAIRHHPVDHPVACTAALNMRAGCLKYNGEPASTTANIGNVFATRI